MIARARPVEDRRKINNIHCNILPILEGYKANANLQRAALREQSQIDIHTSSLKSHNHRRFLQLYIFHHNNHIKNICTYMYIMCK